MTQALYPKMPSQLFLVGQAADTWKKLADMVINDADPVVTLPYEDKRDLTLLTNMSGASVVNGPTGRVVTLLLDEPAPVNDGGPDVTKAAAAPSKFASGAYQPE